MSSVFAAIGRFSVRFKWLVVAAWLLLTIILSATMPTLASKTQGNNQDFLPASSASMRAGALAASFGAANLVPVTVVAHRDGGALTAADAAALQRLETRLADVSGVTSVRDLGRSSDGSAEQVQLLAKVTEGMMSDQSKSLVDALRTTISGTGRPSGLDVHLAGDLPSQVDNQARSGNTAGKLLDLSAVFVIVLLLLIFRSPIAPLLAFFPAFLSTNIASRLVGELTYSGLKVSPLAQMMLIVLVIGAGTDYALFLIFRMREELRRGRAPGEAVVEALRRVGESVTFSAATVVAALLSLLVASFALYSDLGEPLAVGIAVTLVAALTLLPALLAIFGRLVFWPSRTRPGAHGAQWWGRASGRIVRRPVVILAAGVVLFAALAAASTGYQASGFGGALQAPGGTDSAAGNDLLARYFPGASADPTYLVYRLRTPAWQRPGALAEATARLGDSSLFNRVSGPLGPSTAALDPARYTALHAELGPADRLPATPPAGTTVAPAEYNAYRATGNYVSADGMTVRFGTGLSAGDAQSTAAMNVVPAVRDEARQVAGTLNAVDFGVAGQAPTAYDIGQISSSDLRTVIPVAIVVIGVLLGLVLRSLVAPLYLIASVALSYFAAFGLAVLLFITLGGDTGLTFILPFLMFVFLLALGEDYNILIMTRVREEAHRRPLREAVAQALNVTGTTITSAGLVLAGTFAVFAIVGGRGPNGGTVVQIAAGLAIGILMDTFVVRTLLVPATVVLIGRWNWWPSRLSRRDLPAGPAPEPVSDPAEQPRPEDGGAWMAPAAGR